MVHYNLINLYVLYEQYTVVYKHCSTRIHIRHKISSIQEHDEPILKTLTSIDLKFIDEEKASEDSSEESKEGNMVHSCHV
jgi:hypothetical protein